MGVRVPPLARSIVSKGYQLKTSVVEKGKWERELEVEVPADRLEPEVKKALKSYQKHLEIPGFRKGRVPLNEVKRRYGDAIRGNVINDLLPVLLEEAAKETGLVPAAPPRIDKLDYEPGTPLTFTATLDIWPEIEVDNYEGLQATKLIHEVTEEEIDKQLLDIQNGQATEQLVERALDKGDVLIADLQRLDEGGLPVVGDRFEERYFLIGSEESASPEFEEAVLGISAGEERRVRFSYRKDLPNEQLAGKAEHFSVTAKEVRERQVPELDDEFAKDLGEQFADLAGLREHILKQLSRQWESVSQQKLRSDLTAELIKQNPFELPESMLQNYMRTLRRERENQQHHHHDEEGGPDFSDEERTTAIRQLKGYLLIEAVAKKAAVEVSDEEFDEHLRQRAEGMGLEPEKLKRSAKIDDLRKEVRDSRVFEMLSERAKFSDEAV